MARGANVLVVTLFSLVLVASLFLTGCTRYANEEKIAVLEESQAAATATEEKVAELETEKAELEAKLAEKQEELKMVQGEKAKVKAAQ